MNAPRMFSKSPILRLTSAPRGRPPLLLLLRAALISRYSPPSRPGAPVRPGCRKRGRRSSGAKAGPNPTGRGTNGS